MPNCSICGQHIEKLPNWLDDVEITFRCAACAESTAHHPIEAHDEDEEATKEVATPEAEAEDEEEEAEDEEE